MTDRDELTRRAEALAPALHGMSMDEARARAEAEGLTIRFPSEGQAATTAYVFGRLTAWLRDGVVEQATVG